MEKIDDGVLAALGLKLVNVVAAAVVSFSALRFFDNLTTRDKWMTFAGGWALAAWGAAPLAAWLEAKPPIEVGLVLVLGLFGMAVAAELVRLVRGTDWRGLVDSLIRRKG
jgi:hypothetical protein